MRLLVCPIRRFSTSLARHFITTEVRATRRKSFSASGLGCLGTGTIIDDFYRSGTLRNLGHRLKADVNTGDSSSAQALRSLGVKRSGPAALLTQTVFRTLHTSSSVTCSDEGALLGMGASVRLFKLCVEGVELLCQVLLTTRWHRGRLCLGVACECLQALPA